METTSSVAWLFRHLNLKLQCVNLCNLCKNNFCRPQVDIRESSVLSGPNYLELSGLQGNRRYDFWVKAETSKGYGPASDITSIILARTGNGSFINDVTQIQTCYDPHHYSAMQLLPIAFCTWVTKGFHCALFLCGVLNSFSSAGLFEVR